MKITIRLYRRHDMDLLALYKNPNFNFQKVVRDSLRAYVRGVQYFVYIPKCAKDLAHFQFNPSYQFTISLDDVSDADVIAWLNQAQPRLKNALVKSVMRGCIVGASVFACLKSDSERERANMIAEMLPNSPLTIMRPPTGRHTMSKQAKIKSRETADTQNILAISRAREFNAEQYGYKCHENKNIESRHIDESGTVRNTATLGDGAYAYCDNITNRTARDANNTQDTMVSETKNVARSNMQNSLSASSQHNTPDMQVYENESFDLDGFGDDIETPTSNSASTDAETFDLFGDVAKMMSSLSH